MITVIMSREDGPYFAYIAGKRRSFSLYDGRKDRFGYQGENPYEIDYHGAGSEWAVAIAFDLPWTGDVDTFKLPDVGATVQVRWAEDRRGTSHLLLRPPDNVSYNYVFVTGCYPVYWIWGWMRGADAKQPKYLKTNFTGADGRPTPRQDPCYLIPRGDLIQFNERVIDRRTGS